MFSGINTEEINPNILTRELPIVVTGGSGYMASWLVKYLLEDGYSVRITVRSIEDETKYQHLTKIAERATGRLEVFEANLMEPGAFDMCMNGCNVVFHTASPYLLKGIKDPKTELIDPSLEGTRNVLESVDKTYSVKRVIFTSAIAAIYGDASDMVNTGGNPFNESYWNKSSNLKHQPLGFAKTVAEREAWKMHDAQDRWKMVSLNPALFVGPSLTAKSTSGTFQFIRQLADGTLKAGVPDIKIGLVDVRDVAQAHIFAAQDEFATGRFMLVHEVKSILDIANTLRNKFGEEFKIPREFMSKNMLYFFGFTQGYSRKFVIENVGKDLQFDNTKSRHELGMYYKPVDEALIELLQFIIDHNMLK